jgi:hypothetical protein
MEVEKFLEVIKELDSKKKGKKEETEKFTKLFERFHLLNKKYLEKEAFEEAKSTISSMAETMANTMSYLDEEIAHLRSRRMKQPVDNVTLSEMQKVQNRNETLIREYLAEQQE